MRIATENYISGGIVLSEDGGKPISKWSNLNLITEFASTLSGIS